MKRKYAAEDAVVEETPEGELEDLEVASGYSRSRTGTISFPVRGEPIYAPVADNTDLIAEVIRKRQPTLLLCAGWSVPTEQNLPPIIALTQHIKTVVVLE